MSILDSISQSQIRDFFVDIFFLYFSSKAYVMIPHQNRLFKTVLMRDTTYGFVTLLLKIIHYYPQKLRLVRQLLFSASCFTLFLPLQKHSKALPQNKPIELRSANNAVSSLNTLFVKESVGETTNCTYLRCINVCGF